MSEVLYCESAADADTLLKGLESNGKAQAGLSPPKSLGSTAVERLGSDSTYLIAWRRGTAFELTGLSTDLPSSSTTSTTTGTPVPLTAHDKQVLANAATQQSARFTNVAVSSGTSGSAADAKAQAAANATSVAAGCPKNPATALQKPKWSSAPATIIDAAKTYTATVKTDVGTFVIALDAKDAPQTVNNFVFLAQHRFFDCVIFHRVIPGFMDQTGDPTGTGSGGPGYTIPDELPAKASNPADPVPARIRGHGQHRPTAYRRQPVVHRRRSGGRIATEFVLPVRSCHLGDERCRKDQCARKRLRSPSQRHPPDAEGHDHLVLTVAARPTPTSPGAPS